nr:bifunctional aminoglycoside phosphotransferase/ATP-binding protein [Caulobacter sp. 17J80-11]
MRAEAERVIETHCAVVFLAGRRARKLKKPVDLGYLDFSTLEKRRWAIGRELAFNRETAPEIYLATDEVEGEPVLEMRRFDEDAVLARTPERVDGELAEQLGRAVARFHLGARVTPGGANLRYVLDSNAGIVRALDLGHERTERWAAATEAAFADCEDLLEERRRAGLARRCHGDLHLGNLFVEDGRPVMFDCIEFSDVLSEIDVLYDLAFLLMDLTFRGRVEAANRVMNAWLDEAARGFGDAAFTGLRALPLFLSVRAAVRCHVSAQMGDRDLAGRYLDAAIAHLAPAPASLGAVGGLSGSGKTTWARRMAPSLGTSPGAVVLRSDEIRKRLWDKGALDRLPPEAYAAGQSERVYAKMFHEAGLCLAAGRSTVLDAVFLKPEERSAAEALAREAGVSFDGVWLEAPVEVMHARVSARVGDASDADAAVLEAQLARDPGAIGWARKRL